MKTPSEILAKKIVERLVEEKLLGAKAAQKIQKALAEGKTSAEDWRLAIEIGEPKESA